MGAGLGLIVGLALGQPRGADAALADEEIARLIAQLEAIEAQNRQLGAWVAEAPALPPGVELALQAPPGEAVPEVDAVTEADAAPRAEPSAAPPAAAPRAEPSAAPPAAAPRAEPSAAPPAAAPSAKAWSAGEAGPPGWPAGVPANLHPAAVEAAVRAAIEGAGELAAVDCARFPCVVAVRSLDPAVPCCDALQQRLRAIEGYLRYSGPTQPLTVGGHAVVITAWYPQRAELDMGALARRMDALRRSL